MLARLCRGYSDEYTEICPRGTYGQEEEMKEAVNNADAVTQAEGGFSGKPVGAQRSLRLGSEQRDDQKWKVCLTLFWKNSHEAC